MTLGLVGVRAVPAIMGQVRRVGVRAAPAIMRQVRQVRQVRRVGRDKGEPSAFL